MVNLPLEVWELIIDYAPPTTLIALAQTNSHFQQYILNYRLPSLFSSLDLQIPSVSILQFNGFHSYRSDQRLKYTGLSYPSLAQSYPSGGGGGVSVSRYPYLQFDILDPLRYFKINRIDDINDVKITRRMQGVDEPNPEESATGLQISELREEKWLRKWILSKYVLIAQHEKGILVPAFLVLQSVPHDKQSGPRIRASDDDNEGGWEFEVPCVVPSPTNLYSGQVSVSLYGMGVPDQTWSSSFSSGQNLPI